MGSITLLLGKTRSRRKRAMVRLGHASVDTNGRPDFLVLTATQRKAEQVRQEFLGHGSRGACFSPEVRVFSEYVESLAQRHVSGKAILSDYARAHLAWEQMGTSESLAAAEALAAIHALVGESNLPSKGLPMAPDIRRHLLELDEAVAGLTTHMPLEHTFALLRRALPHPPDSLQRELGRFSSIVIDDILQLSPLRSNLLVDLCRAWEREGSNVVVCFECPHSLGGSEVGAFFNYDPLLASAYSLRSIDASRKLRCFLFEELIGRGNGHVCIATSEGHVLVEPGDPDRDAECRDLSDRIYDSKPLELTTHEEAAALLEDRIRLLHCPELHQEFQTVAALVHAAIQRGVSPSDCCVAVADLDRHLPLLAEVFGDNGLCLDVATGPTLASLPIPRLLARVLNALSGEQPHLELLQELVSDLVSLPEGLQLEAVHSLCRTTGVRSGTALDWLDAWKSTGLAVPEITEESAHHFHRLVTRCQEGMAAAECPRTYRQWVLDLATLIGLPGTCTRSGVSKTATRLGHRSWAATLTVIDSWTRELLSTGLTHWNVGLLSSTLERRLARTRCATDARRSGAVSIVGILELRGLTPRHLFIANLVRSAFPTPRRKNVLLPDRSLQQLEVIEPMSEARYLLISAIRNALGDGDIERLTLTWSSSTGDQINVPAPALQDLLSLRTCSAENKTLGSLIVETVTPNSLSTPSTATRLARYAHSLERDTTNALEVGFLERQHQAALARRGDHFSPHDGCLAEPPALPASIGPTGVESYLRCPARYWYSRVLRLTAESAWEPQLSPVVRGTAIHRILERYEQQPSEEAEQAERLHAVATEVFEDLKVGFTGDLTLLEFDLSRLTAGLVDERPGGSLKAWLELEREHSWRTPIASELAFDGIPLGPVTLRGSIDRVDHLAGLGAHLVIDFKTGAAPSASLVQRGLAFQPIAYLEAAARKWPGEEGIAAYMTIGRSGQVSFATWVGTPDLIHSLVPSRRRRSAVPIDESQRRECMTHAAESMTRMARGVFHTTLADPIEAGCRTCDYARICRLDTARNERVLRGGGDLQQPIDGVFE